MRYTHCTSCAQPMDEVACGIDWHAVYVAQRVQQHMERHARIPTHEELTAIDQEAGSDPCDDCCCGGCGARKAEPGTTCC